MTALAGWENFYVIVGSAAGALIGLEFVVCDAYCRQSDTTCGGGFCCFCDADDRSFRSRAVAVNDCKRSVAQDRNRVSCLGFSRSQWDSRHRHRVSAYESANHLPARVRGLVVSCSASICGVCNAGWIGIRGSLSCAPSSVRRWRCDAAAPLCWHSQCLGRRHVPRTCQEACRSSSLCRGRIRGEQFRVMDFEPAKGGWVAYKDHSSELYLGVSN